MHGRLARLYSKLFILAVAALAFYGGARSVLAAGELARIGSRVITVEEFNKKYQDNLKYFQNLPPAKKAVLNDMVNREVGVQEARKVGLDHDPEVLERMNAVLYQSLLEKKLNKEIEAIQVTDEEARKFYAARPEIRTSHIFVAVRPDASAQEDAEAKKKILGLLAMLHDSRTSFAEVAQKYSEGVAAPNGGDIDYQTRDKLDSRYYEAALALKAPGKFTAEPVRSQFGWHVIKLTAVRPWEETDKGQVKRQILEERKTALFEKYMEQLRRQHGVVIHTELLR